MTNIRLFDIGEPMLRRRREIEFKQLMMPGGEPFVELPYGEVVGQCLMVDARVGSMDDWGILLATLDALHRIPLPQKVLLFLPYFPGARGDRVLTGDGTALAAQMYQRMLDLYDLHRVVILDPHSDVTPALLGHNVTTLSISDVVGSLRALGPAGPVWFAEDHQTYPTWDAVICPDQGAEKRTAAAAQRLGIERVISARKHRDMSTGVLGNFEVDDLGPAIPIENVRPGGHSARAGRFLIVDDICDGGGTFQGLARAIRQQGRNHRDCQIDLFVSHGIFSRGVDALTEINHVYCTDSFPGRYRHPGERPIDGLVSLDTLHDLIIERHT